MGHVGGQDPVSKESARLVDLIFENYLAVLVLKMKIAGLADFLGHVGGQEPGPKKIRQACRWYFSELSGDVVFENENRRPGGCFWGTLEDRNLSRKNQPGLRISFSELSGNFVSENEVRRSGGFFGSRWWTGRCANKIRQACSCGSENETRRPGRSLWGTLVDRRQEPVQKKSARPGNCGLTFKSAGLTDFFGARWWSGTCPKRIPQACGFIFRIFWQNWF